MKIYNIEQGTEEWFALRAGVPTASEAKKLVTGTGKKSTQITEYAFQLAGESYAGKPLDRWQGNDSTERGKLLEQEAMIAYEQKKGVWVDHVGFCTVDDGSYGCSPDGLHGLLDVDDGMVEIKCLEAKNHVKAYVYYKENKKTMPDYISQTQMQMLVCDRAWCDLVFYHPDLPMLIIRQERDKKVQELLLEQLKRCVDIRNSAVIALTENTGRS